MHILLTFDLVLRHDSVVGILLPLLLQAVALREAGFPDDCGNYYQQLNVTAIAEYGDGFCTSDGAYLLSEFLLEGTTVRVLR